MMVVSTSSNATHAVRFRKCLFCPNNIFIFHRTEPGPILYRYIFSCLLIVQVVSGWTRANVSWERMQHQVSLRLEGLIEDLFIDFFTQSASGAFARVGRGQTHARTKVRIRNLLLVLSPGRGLAEAGGSHGTYWKAGSNLQEGKAAVVDLICRRLSAPFPDRLRRSMSFSWN